MTKRQGFSILEALIAVVIVSFLSLVLATVVSNQQKEMKALVQKSEVIEVKTNLLQNLNLDEVCTWQFKDKVVDTTNVTSTQKSSTTLSFNKIHIGPNASSATLAQAGQKLDGTQSGLMVSAISFEDIVATGIPDEYKGYLTIHFAEQFLVRPLRPARIQKLIHVVGTDPVSARRIDRCVVTSYSDVFSVPIGTLKTYHSGVKLDCSNMNTEKMFYDSACSRFCGTGCANADSTCTSALGGKGFISGMANECNGINALTQCLCLR